MVIGTAEWVGDGTNTAMARGLVPMGTIHARNVGYTVIVQPKQRSINICV